MEFLLLGRMIVTVDGREIDLGRRRERFILGLLLLDVGKVITIDRLIDLLWEGEAPDDPRAAVQVHISRLRRSLADAGARPSDVVIRYLAGGYLVETDPNAIDVHRFAAGVRSARLANDAADRSAILTAALSLWRGQPLEDVVPDHLSGRLFEHLAEARRAALDLRIEADLALGRHESLIPELTRLGSENPTDERMAEARMRALCKVGRQPEALAVYQHLADELRREFGLDPSPRLRALRTAILRDDNLAGDQAGRARPAQLPAEASHFIGRDKELQAIVDALAARPEAATPIVTITGMSGIGKTAMAVRGAHRLAARYPDGQLFLNLHGFTEGVDPVGPSEALERMLRALGVPAADIPYELDDRAALFRGIVAERRLLIVLDNASSEKQVTPMLTASPTSLLLITSRLSLAGLDNSIAFDLGLLSHTDAVALLIRLLGDPGAASPNIADEVVELCGRLPLAIRLAAARLRRRRSWTLADLADRLRDEQGRLQELEAGERSVAAAITLSVDQLQREQRHLLLVLGLTPCLSFDLDTIAAASGLDRRRAAQLVEQLVDAHLLDEPAPGRYQFHDLIRVFTASAATNNLPAAEHGAVAARLLQHYLSGVGSAMTTMAPYARHRRLLAAMEAGTFPPFADDASAAAWLRAEHANLLAIAVWAGEHGLHDGVRTLSEGLFYYMETFACYADGVTLYGYSAEESRKHGDDIGEANALRAVGIFCKCLGRIPEAVAALDQCLEIFRRNGASLSEAAALITLAELLTAIGSLDVAAEHASRAHSIFRAGGDRMGEEYALRHIGALRWMRGDREGAIAAAERARVLCREAGNRIGEAEAQLRLGAISREQGRLAVADEELSHALELVMETGEREGECFVRTELGTLRSIEGDEDGANAHFQVALTLAHEIGSRAAEFAALHGIGEALLRSGDLDRALHHFQAALDLAKRIGLTRDFVRANDGVARTLHAMNRTSRAIEIWRQTLDEHGKIDIVEIAAIRARLDQLGPHTIEPPVVWSADGFHFAPGAGRPESSGR